MAEEVPCADGVVGISNESVNMIQAMKPILGKIPAYCRDMDLPTDDENDLALKKFVTEMEAKSDNNTSGEDVYSKMFTVMKMVAMKKMWQMTSDNTRLDLYLSNECTGFDLNKWPIFSDETRLKYKDENKEKKVELSFKKLCGLGISSWQGSHEGHELLAPYLSKDVLTESLHILSKIYPKDFGQIKKSSCELIQNTPESILTENEYDNFILGFTETENSKKFADWVQAHLVTKAPENKNNSYGYYSMSMKGVYEVNNNLLSAIQKSFQGNLSQEELNKILTTEERGAIQNYTGSGYSSMNACLRNGTCIGNSKEQVTLAISAIVKLQKAKTVEDSRLLFRGTRAIPDTIKLQLKEAIEKKKPVVLDKGFLSTSGHSSTAKGFAGAYEIKNNKLHGMVEDSTVYVIKSKKCVGISQLSNFDQSEDEFLCPPSSKFIPRKTKIEGVIELEEVE